MYIPQDAKKVSVLVSGGMDSTILLYLLAKNISDNNLDIQLNAVSFKAGTVVPERVKKIVWYVEKLFSIKIPHTSSAKFGWIREVVSDVLKVYEVDYVYTGCNLVVNDKFTPTRYIRNETPPVRGEPLNEHHLRPFISYDKIKIVELYLQNNLLDLLKMTHSCGFSPNEECGECYFCTEKIWATKTLNVHQLFNYTNNIHNV
jgi:hypothetical protein